MTKASELIAKLDLQPHPEGGWYKETWRAPADEGERASGTLIHFLLESHQSSHWHRVDAAEIWLWHAGNPLELSLNTPSTSEVSSVVLGPDLTGDHVAQHVIAPHEWQAARPVPGPFDFTLVSCVVSPGFEFSGFTLAPEGWSPQGGGSAA
ncbi:cupin domain-containing protein [Aurantiacibacter sp. MUD61]|uniref:cupin domain-containing protein n=1 Tax=Aurantiacibacter sp. MUD61 TaxID=3009083 RepID=UPI0022F025C3|nr:cupin domain-containing protein [Aurantiacibacter sp. MUD61]